MRWPPSEFLTLTGLGASLALNSQGCRSRSNPGLALANAFGVNVSDEFLLCDFCAFLWLEMGFVAKFFDGGEEAGAFGFVGGLAVGHDELFEAGEFFVETGVFDWWCQVGD